MSQAEFSYRTILFTEEEGVATIFLNRPERRNAIGVEMVNELLYALESAKDNEAVRVLVLTGAGKAFCAGGDFSQMTSGAEEGKLPPKGDYADLLLAMVRYPKPIIARVNGHALGGGLGLVAASTFAIASTEAEVGTPEINVGLFPMMIMAVLSRLVPRRELLRMLLLGERMKAEEGARIGLLDQAVLPDELDESVAELAQKLIAKSPIAIELGLEAISAQDDLDLATALPMLRERLSGILATNDAREGLMAFLEKRPPKWTGS